MLREYIKIYLMIKREIFQFEVGEQYARFEYFKE